MSPHLSTAICREHLAVLSVWQSHKAPPPCALFSYLVAFELTLQDSVHLLLASCCVSVLWISHLLCAAGSAAALHCLLLPSPLSMSLHSELLLKDEVVSLPKVFLETCFLQTRYQISQERSFISLLLHHCLSKNTYIYIEEWKDLCFIFPCTCFLLSFLLSFQCCLGLSILSRLVFLLPPTH